MTWHSADIKPPLNKWCKSQVAQGEMYISETDISEIVEMKVNSHFEHGWYDFDKQAWFNNRNEQVTPSKWAKRI